MIRSRRRGHFLREQEYYCGAIQQSLSGAHKLVKKLQSSEE